MLARRATASLWLPTLLCAALVTSSFAALAGPPPRVTDGSTYRVSRSAATGRAGTASLELRALLGRDGETVVDVTTGTLDVPGAPGAIAKLQVKLLDGDGRALFTENQDKLDAPTVSFTLDGLARGELLAVQANVRGIDGRRTDVVTVDERVRWRPDLAVVALDVAPSVPVDTVVTIDAVVAEQNLDTGARADCVLFVDGLAVDRAVAIWVDAGDTVTCAFTHVFGVAGIHAVEVAVVGVQPGDDAPENNALATTVEVTAGIALAGRASFSEVEYHAMRDYSGWYEYRYPSSRQGVAWAWYDTKDQWTQTSQLAAWASENVEFPLVGVELTQESAGQTHTWSLRDVPAGPREYLGYYDRTCAWEWNPEDGASLQVCAYTWHVAHAPDIGTWIEYKKRVGSVVYHSEGTEHVWFVGSDGVATGQSWSWNETETLGDSPRWSVGDTWTWDVRVDGQTDDFYGTFTADLATTTRGGGHVPSTMHYSSAYRDLHIFYEYGWDETTTSGATSAP